MTDLFGRFMLTVAVLAMLAAVARAAFAETRPITPADAIEQAVRQRVGSHVSVEVTSLDTAVAPARALQALPEPGGRAGEPSRFVLMVGRARRGVAVASVRLTGAHPRASRAIGRNETITSADLDIVEGELKAVVFKRLPAGDDVIGLVARRDIAAGEPLTQAVVQLPPLVRSGDSVVLTVVAGSVQVTTKAIAAASGHAGDVIRVRPEGGRALRARISGRGAVEVVR